MRTVVLLLAVPAVVSLAVAGCSSSSGAGAGTDAGFSEDGSAGFDAAGDGAAPGTDSGSPDSSFVDSTVPDSSVADTAVNDSSAADSFVADSFVADSFVVDSGTPDTHVVDSAPSLDASDCVFLEGGVLDCDVITVTVANPGAALTAYTVPIVLDTRPYVSAGKMKADCSDLAAYGPDQATPLPYWISTAECNGPTTRLFVQVPIPAAGSTTVYLTYGKTPPLAQNGASLFLFFDDFTGSALDTSKWIHQGDGTYTEASGLLTTQHANLLQSVPSVVAAGTTALGVRENANSALGDDFEVGAGTITAVTSQSWLWVNSRTGTWASFVSYSSTNMTVSAGSTVCANVGPIGAVTFDGNWHDTEWRYDLSGGATNASSTREDGLALSHSVDADGGCVTASAEPVLLGLDHGTGTGSDPVTNVDWVYVRTVASPEPAVTVVPPSWVTGGGDAGTD
jgi:hypothetical protein